MTSHQYAQDEHARNAAIERLWTHTIGITNRALANTGTDPASGLPATEWESPGSGLAGLWESHHFIITAGHVLEKAAISDLSFFARPTSSLKHASESEIGLSDAFSAIPIESPNTVIHRCEWEDLALITVEPNSLGPYLEFANIATSWVDPEEKDIVIGLGYPVSAGLIFQTQGGPAIQKSVILSPTAFSGEVLPNHIGRSFGNFIPQDHYLMPFEPANSGKKPGGISGAAAWIQSPEKQIVWTPKFNFAGIFVACYKDGTIVRVVKASVVLGFLTEIFGEFVKPEG